VLAETIIPYGVAPAVPAFPETLSNCPTRELEEEFTPRLASTGIEAADEIGDEAVEN
jgi:hypothetical protein